MARAVAEGAEETSARRILARDVVLEISTLLLLGLLPFLFFWRLFTPAAYDLASIVPGDFTDLHYPNRMYATRELLAGRLPLWNPYVSSGHSALGDIQLGIFYPFNLAVSLLLGQNGALPYQALEAQVAIHFSLASIFTYLFVRRLIGSRLAAVSSSLAFAFGGYLTSFPVQQMIILEVSVWLPLVLLFLDLGVEKRSLSYFVLAGVAACFAILVGHPQTLTYLALVTGAFLVFRLWSERGPWRTLGGGVLLFAAVALGLAAAQLVPSYEHLGLTTRTEVGYEFVKSGFQLRELAGLLLPTMVGGKPLYVGILPLLLAGWALVGSRSRRAAGFWLGLALFGLVMSFGGNTFLHSLEYTLVPGLKLFRNHERTALIFSFATAVLAGYGVKDLLGENTEREGKNYQPFVRWLWWLLLSMIVVSLVFYAMAPSAADAVRPQANELADRSLFATIVLFLSLILFHLRSQVGLASVPTGVLVILLIGFDLFSTNWQNNLRLVPPERALPQTELVKMVQGGVGEYRVASEGLLPGDGNAGSVFGFQDVVGNSPLEFKNYSTFEKEVEEWQRWQLLNVRYILTRRNLADGRFKQVGKAEDVNVYEIQPEHRFPRASIVYSAIVADSDDASFQMIKKADLRNQVVLPHAPDLKLPENPPPGTPAQVIDYRSDRIRVRADLPENGILVLSEVSYPGWRALVDGAPTTIVPANYLLRAVPLARGEHIVDFVYDPDSLRIGTQLSIATAILAVLVAGVEFAASGPRWVRRKSTSATNTEEE